MLPLIEGYERAGMHEAANELRAFAAKHGDPPKKQESELRFADLEQQATRYFERDFHKHLKISKGILKDRIMRLNTLQPEAFRGRFDILVVKFGDIPIAKQCELAGIPPWYDVSRAIDWPSDPKGYVTPKTLHVAWMQDGTNRPAISVKDVRTQLAPDERGATQWDGVAYCITCPDINAVLNHHYIDLPGTSVASGSAPGLRLWGGQPGLGGGSVEPAGPDWRAASCGRVE